MSNKYIKGFYKKYFESDKHITALIITKCNIKKCKIGSRSCEECEYHFVLNNENNFVLCEKK